MSKTLGRLRCWGPAGYGRCLVQSVLSGVCVSDEEYKKSSEIIREASRINKAQGRAPYYDPRPVLQAQGPIREPFIGPADLRGTVYSPLEGCRIPIGLLTRKGHI